ncbi:MAG: PD-(D/E)XK nuclease family protein [Acidimicrobiales bacterium]
MVGIDRRADLERLQVFVDSLHQRVDAVRRASSWADMSSAAQQLLTWLLGAEHRHSSWPEPEQAAFERVEAALVRLSSLDAIEPQPSAEVFQRALRSELDVARGRHGRFGEGVLFGPLSSAVGHDLDAVFVLGAAEGILPVPRRDDAVLPDEVRMASMEKLRTDGARLSDDVRIASIDQLETQALRLQHQQRACLAALAAAPAGAATLTFPRGSLRSSRRSLPSRWLLDSASALGGRTVYATDFDQLDASVVDAVGSHASGIRRSGEAASLGDRDLAVVAEYVDHGGWAGDHPISLDVRRGLDLQRARSGTDFTEFDGNLAGHDVPTSSGRSLSPSRLETWAACGFKYFLSYVLELADRDDPEHLDDITAMDRGSLLHTVLERFIDEAITAGAPAPSEPWSAEQRRRLHEIADDEFAAVEARGRTGRALHWQVRRDDLRDVLDRFLDADNRFRATHAATPTDVELAFGLADRPPVEIDLPNGRTVAFRGLADRVDVSANGHAIVTDYKSGKGRKYEGLMPTRTNPVVDPVLAGTTLQLGLYAEAAMQHTGLDGAVANYWVVEAPAGKELRGYAWEPAHRQRFVDVLAAITDGIDAGSFAAEPGDWDTYFQTNAGCAYCEFDSVCPRDRGEHAEAKSDAEGVTIRRRLQFDPDGWVQDSIEDTER